MNSRYAVSGDGGDKNTRRVDLHMARSANRSIYSARLISYGPSQAAHHTSRSALAYLQVTDRLSWNAVTSPLASIVRVTFSCTM